MKQQRTVFSFFGPPGSGKGTLAQKLVQQDGFQVLSTGNLCRKHMSTGTVLGKQIQHYVEKGHLIPDELITDMVIEWLETLSGTDPVLLDGFPRTQGQAERFLVFLAKHTAEYRFRVVFIELPDDEIINRLSKRLICSNKSCQIPLAGGDAGMTSCPLCGSLLSRRDDDREEVVRERLAQYPAYRKALLAFYTSVKQDVSDLDISGLNPSEVYDHFKALYVNKNIAS